MRASYEERQAEWVKKHDVKVGDPVLLIRAASDGEDTWPNAWPHTADGWIGNILRVKVISDLNIMCYNPDADDWFGFPYFVLEKVESEEKEMKKSYEERQTEWIKENDIEKDDEVRLIREASSGEDGWRNVWPDKANELVGKILKVKGINKTGIACCNQKDGYLFRFPYFVLEKVMEHKDKEWTVSYGLKVKTGDPVLMRSENDSQWTYSLFSYIHTNKKVPYPYYGCGVISSVCIPYRGNEHLAGTTDAYVSEKKEPPKFVFGAKVKATLSSGGEKEGVLIGFDEEDDDKPFEVAVRDEYGEFGRIRYWAKEITYID